MTTTPPQPQQSVWSTLMGNEPAAAHPPPQQPAPQGPPPVQYVQVPAGYVPARVGTNGLAIAALVLGILWLGGIGAVLAIIFGGVALSQINNTGQAGKAMAKWGIALGIVGVLLTAYLYAGAQAQESRDQKFVNVGCAINDYQDPGC